jgi:GNAT superfamily N-acetyltransferase
VCRVGVTLRPATLDDMPAVGALYHRSRVAAYQGFIPIEELQAVPARAMGVWWTERFLHDRDTHRFTVAERDGRLVGFSEIGPDEDDPRHPQLYAIHLAPEEQGRGTGRLLMRDALANMRGQAVLWVFTDNETARRFYERGGWRLDGRTRVGTIGRASRAMVRYSRWLGEGA